MKIKKLFVIVLLILFSISIYAATSTQIKLGNIGGTAITTLLRGVLQGKVKSFKDVVKTLFYGGVSGYGFYQSKKLISDGKIFPGVLLANVSASVVENIAMGKSPLSRIGYTFGFVRMNVYMPFKKINFDFSPKDMVTFAVSLKYSNKIIFRNGMVSFKAKEKFEDAIGWCNGIFPTVVENKGHIEHEIIHMIQNLQLMAISYEPFFHGKKFHLFEIRTQTFNIGFELINNNFFSYENDIREIEARYFIHKRKN